MGFYVNLNLPPPINLFLLPNKDIHVTICMALHVQRDIPFCDGGHNAQK